MDPFRGKMVRELLWAQLYGPGKDGAGKGEWLWKEEIPMNAILLASAIVGVVHSILFCLFLFFQYRHAFDLGWRVTNVIIIPLFIPVFGLRAD